MWREEAEESRQLWSAHSPLTARMEGEFKTHTHQKKKKKGVSSAEEGRRRPPPFATCRVESPHQQQPAEARDGVCLPPRWAGSGGRGEPWAGSSCSGKGAAQTEAGLWGRKAGGERLSPCQKDNAALWPQAAAALCQLSCVSMGGPLLLSVQYLRRTCAGMMRPAVAGSRSRLYAA